MKRLLRLLAGTLIGLLASLLLFAAVVLSLLRAAPGEWSLPLQLGPWQLPLSMPTLLRVATHPMLLRQLEGRSLSMPFGILRVLPGTQPQSWRVVCAACRLHGHPFGRDPFAVRIEFTAQRATPLGWRGEFVLGDAPRAVRGRFKASFDGHGAQLALSLPNTPIADVYQLFADSIAELGRARIAGELRLEAQWRWPQQQLSLQPHIEGFSVSGLGTEALLHAASVCPAPKHGFGRWLPRAVVAAEDQRFFEHSGFDLREMNAAWSRPGTRDDTTRGASTLPQQVAKLLFAGDERSPQRKLRELLYAVELDRTLGKARLLQLYLAIAPWGEGQCGAAAAARHYLGKRVDKLTATEAAWLASLLHNPDREWQDFVHRRQINVPRVGWVIAQLRPMPAAQREALVSALPAWSPARP